MRAPCSRAISQVRSFDPESTSTISSAQRTLPRVRPMLASSSIATMATESVIRELLIVDLKLDSYWPFDQIINNQQSAINNQRSAISNQQSAINKQSTINNIS